MELFRNVIISCIDTIYIYYNKKKTTFINTENKEHIQRKYFKNESGIKPN